MTTTNGHTISTSTTLRLLVLIALLLSCMPQQEDIQYLYYDVDDAPYRFDEMNEMAKQYLYDNGYVVIANIFENENELEYANQLLWNYLNGIGWNKFDPNTWDT